MISKQDLEKYSNEDLNNLIQQIFKILKDRDKESIVGKFESFSDFPSDVLLDIRNLFIEENDENPESEKDLEDWFDSGIYMEQNSVDDFEIKFIGEFLTNKYKIELHGSKRIKDQNLSEMEYDKYYIYKL